MMLADLKEKRENRVVVTGTDPTAFREFLKYVYFLEINFEKITEDVLLQICALAHQYDVGSLVGANYNFMLDSLTVENVLARLRVAELYDFLELQADCWDFVEAETAAVIQDDSFLELPRVRSNL
jgi:hypothetical protein